MSELYSAFNSINWEIIFHEVINLVSLPCLLGRRVAIVLSHSFILVMILFSAAVESNRGILFVY